MKGDISLAGFLLTADEWDALDSRSRQQLVEAAQRRDDVWVVADLSGGIAVRTDSEDAHR